MFSVSSKTVKCSNDNSVNGARGAGRVREGGRKGNCVGEERLQRREREGTGGSGASSEARSGSVGPSE